MPHQALVLLLGVPMLLGVLNFLWFVKIVRGAYKLVFSKKQQQQQHPQQQDKPALHIAAATAAVVPTLASSTTATVATAAGRAGKLRVLARNVVSIRAFAEGVDFPAGVRRSESPE